MTQARDTAVVFRCNGEALLGILSEPADAPAKKRAVLLIVGGPQYRVGSHRQFYRLAQSLAAAGYPVLRFDYRGMGDSTGNARSFESVGEDIACAADTLLAACPAVTDLVAWGLCDGASAALMFAAADPRFSGLILLNPWVRSESSLARTHLNHYYFARLLQRDFWARLIGGQLNPARAFGSFLRNAQAVLGASPSSATPNFIQAMRAGMQRFSGRVLLILSENDLTANEFGDLATRDPEWARSLERTTVATMRVARADHTFSSAAWRQQVERASLEWLDSQ